MDNAIYRWALALALLICGTPVAADELVFAYQNIDNAPFQIGDGHEVPAHNRGVAVEQILALEQALGVKVVLKRYPWKRALVMLQAGSVDGVFNASYKKKREEFGRYPSVDSAQGPVLDHDRRSYTNSYSFFINKSHASAWQNYQVDNISGTVHVPLGFSIADDLRKLGVDIFEVSDVKNYARLLDRDRIAALALLTPSGVSMFEKQDEFANIQMVKPAILEKDYFLMLSHQFVESHPELAEKIWDSVAEYRKSKAFVAGLNKYSSASTLNH